jgi:hypothetical protein
MKRKRKWVGVLEYRDKNMRRRELKSFLRLTQFQREEQ